MQDDVQAKVSGPGVGLIVIGALNLVFWLGWSAWALVAVVLQGGLAAVAVVVNGQEGVGNVLVAVWTFLMQGCNGFTGLLLAVGAVVTIRAGMKLREASSKGIVNMGLAALVVSPLVSILIGLGTAVLSLSCCGLFFGQLPTIVLFLVNAGIVAWVVSVMGDPDVAAAFEANGG